MSHSMTSPVMLSAVLGNTKASRELSSSVTHRSESREPECANSDTSRGVRTQDAFFCTSDSTVGPVLEIVKSKGEKR